MVIVLALCTPLVVFAQSNTANNASKKKKSTKTPTTTQTRKGSRVESRMTVEIWSDVVCPFCYIGKRKFEAGLQQFADSANIEIVWKSYQLQPDITEDYNKSTFQLVAEKYNITLEQSKSMHANLVRSAADVGLTYNFDIAKPVNTLKAHQFIQFAKTHGKQDEAEELLFKSYFTLGKNINDVSTLVEIGALIGLDKGAVKDVIESNKFVQEVQADINEAQQIGVRGVPFFVFNRKYAISGAQEPTAFLETLKKSFNEWRKDNPVIQLDVLEGNICTPDGVCD